MGALLTGCIVLAGCSNGADPVNTGPAPRTGSVSVTGSVSATSSGVPSGGVLAGPSPSGSSAPDGAQPSGSAAARKQEAFGYLGQGVQTFNYSDVTAFVADPEIGPALLKGPNFKGRGIWEAKDLAWMLHTSGESPWRQVYKFTDAFDLARLDKAFTAAGAPKREAGGITIYQTLNAKNVRPLPSAFITGYAYLDRARRVLIAEEADATSLQPVAVPPAVTAATAGMADAPQVTGVFGAEACVRPSERGLSNPDPTARSSAPAQASAATAGLDLAEPVGLVSSLDADRQLRVSALFADDATAAAQAAPRRQLLAERGVRVYAQAAPAPEPDAWTVRQAGPVLTFGARWPSADAAMQAMGAMLFSEQPWNLCG